MTNESPVAIEVVENLWIPLSDGTHVAARMWLPTDAVQNPVPALLEYIPYRKRDWTSVRDEAMHPYFARYGYASVRVDIRGSGESEGVLLGEYLQQEQDDALDVIDWLSQQSWCSGQVGMFGKSWGGFNALQIAARQPPTLGAIITVYSTVDRFADDIHTMGGCQLTSNAGWGSVMFEYNTRPPDPELVGDRWRDMWLERLENSPPWILEWLEHQTRDKFWTHGSVIENYAAITCPVYAIGGWADGYTNAVPKLLAGLSVPRKGIVGPWGHQYPHQAHPKPDYGFLQDALRWWDYWLKGKNNGIVDEPMFRVWMQESIRPNARIAYRPGRWVTVTNWPIPNASNQIYYLNSGCKLGLDPTTSESIIISSPQSTGETCLKWSASGDLVADHPTDQRIDDARSLVFDSQPLSDRIEILGQPRVRLKIRSDSANAIVAVRLCDVAPNGESTRVTYGLLNLTHRNGSAHPEKLEPGRSYNVDLSLKHIAYVFTPGSRIRVAVQTSFWPIAWPSPTQTTLSITSGDSKIELPIFSPGSEVLPVSELPVAEQSEVEPRSFVEPPKAKTTCLIKDVDSGLMTVRVDKDSGLTRLENHGLMYGDSSRVEYTIRDDDPTSARSEFWSTMRMSRGAWSVKTKTHTKLTCDDENFLVEADVTALEGDNVVFSKKWAQKTPRSDV